MNEINYKTCIDCNESKEESKFAKKGKESGRRTRCTTCQGKKRAKRDPEGLKLKNRRTQLRLKYSMSLEDYNQMYNNQQGLCKICGDFYNLLFIDHCHSTNKIRGLLCNGCNSGLGFFKDNSNILNRAILYLKETNTDKNKL